MPQNVGLRLRGARAALWGGFLVHGVATVLLGPLIPELREVWGASRSDLAMLFPAQFVASSVGAVLSSLRPKRSLVAGYACVSLGLVLVAWLPWPMPLCGFAVVGFGLGLVAAATNLHVARLSGPGGDAQGRRSSDLSLLNMLWCLGAVACPLVFAAAEGFIPARWLLLGLAGLSALPALLLTHLLTEPQRDSEPTELGPSSWHVALGLLPTAGLFFLYVGVETTLSGWLVSLAESLDGGHGSDQSASLVPLLIGSGFWAALLVGRGLAPWVLRRVAEPRLFVIAVLVALVGSLGLRFSESQWLVASSAVVLGFGLAPVFPLLVSRLAGQTETEGRRQVGWVFACAGLGGAALPWLTARLPAPDAGLALGFIVPVAALVLMLLLFAVQQFGVRGRPEEDC